MGVILLYKGENPLYSQLSVGKNCYITILPGVGVGGGERSAIYPFFPGGKMARGHLTNIFIYLYNVIYLCI